MIITSPTSIFDPFDDSYRFDRMVSEALRDRRYKEVKRVTKTLKSKLVKCDNRCRFEDVKVELISRGMREENIDHLKNDIIDQLTIEFCGSKILLRHPLFPKIEHVRDILIEIKPYNIDFRVEGKSTPHSITDFIMAAIEWLPEYAKIDEEIRIEINQAEMAREMSVDLLKRVVGAILTEKGYEYEVYSKAHSNNASLRINISENFSVDMEITFNGNFLDQVVRYVQAMPIKESI